MRKLHISEDLALPHEAVTQTVVVYGAKGMGKTNFGSVFAEEMYAAHLRFSVIDPMGVWWGLQHGSKHGEPGLEVLILGGVHGDLPIEPTGGEVVADLVADESISVVIDISRRADGKAWTKGEKVRFVTAYMLRLYERQVEHRRPLMQIIDEAARYAPQGLRSGDVDESKCLGAIAMVCEEGRNLGIGLTLLTQRSARLNKDVAELADVLVAFRTVGPNSVGAITDWLGDHVAKDEHGFLLTGRDVPSDCLPAFGADRPLFLETSRPGVFAVGDVHSGSIKRVASAVGEGSMAVRFVHQYLAEAGASA